MPSNRVRDAAPEDAPALARIHVDAWRAGYRGLFRDEVLDALSVEDRTEKWGERIEGGTVVWVSEGPDGAIAAFLAIAPDDEDEDPLPGAANIGALYTDPGTWGQGHAAGLFDHAVAWMRSYDEERDAREARLVLDLR